MSTSVHLCSLLCNCMQLTHPRAQRRKCQIAPTFLIAPSSLSCEGMIRTRVHVCIYCTRTHLCIIRYERTLQTLSEHSISLLFLCGCGLNCLKKVEVRGSPHVFSAHTRSRHLKFQIRARECSPGTHTYKDRVVWVGRHL